MSTKSRPVRQGGLDALTRALGRTIGGDLPMGVGFSLLLFHYGQGEAHYLSYISSADRADMIKTMRECIERLEAQNGG